MITRYFLCCKTLQANIYPIYFSGMLTDFLGCAFDAATYANLTIFIIHKQSQNINQVHLHSATWH